MKVVNGSCHFFILVHAGANKLEPGFCKMDFVVPAERPLPHPLDKSDGGSRDDIALTITKKSSFLNAIHINL